MLTFKEIIHEIRKFGLEYCDLPTMLENVSILLRVLTVNIDSKYKKGITILSYIVTAVTAACFYYVFLFSMTWFVFWRSRITGELVGAMVVLSLGISSEIGPFKLFYMCYYMDKTQKIADSFLECDANTIKGTRFHTNLMKRLRSVKKRAMLYWVVVAGNGVLYVMKPVAMRGRNLPENYFLIYGLEPMFETPNYQIAYFMMIASVFFVCYVPASVTAFLIVITGYAEAQMLALSEEMLQLWSDATNHAKAQTEGMSEELDVYDPKVKMIINQFVERRLREIIGRHANVINLLNQVEIVFRQAIAIGFVLLVLGLLSELLGKLENTFLQLPFALMQVSMDCFAGQRVMDASAMFEASVYDCKWENFDKSNMKLVLVMLQNAQKTMTLSAGGVRTLSFSALMSVFRGIYSAYTALRMRNYKRKTERGKVSIELKPLPKAPPRLSKTNKRRIRKSAILTDTPEKNALAEEKETRGKSNSKIKKQKVEKRVGKKKTAVTIKRNKKEASESAYVVMCENVKRKVLQEDADESDSEVDSME
ncbi:hypothetical protein HF086_015542 [Spodoptera exigua]|uniref:Odorant receptor n=1 Tax=Spodoptera exigua TaxID=7107 RepID=A0A922MG54_SPOEX|nr:hypothetical protein HF086_015542 [Spodoptera exigua]